MGERAMVHLFKIEPGDPKLLVRMLALWMRSAALPDHARFHVATKFLAFVEITVADINSSHTISHSELDVLDGLTAVWERPCIVHILYGGRPLCDAWPGKEPREWPQGERWTPIEEPQPCTCPGCRDAFVRACTAS